MGTQAKRLSLALGPFGRQSVPSACYQRVSVYCVPLASLLRGYARSLRSHSTLCEFNTFELRTERAHCVPHIDPHEQVFCALHSLTENI